MSSTEAILTDIDPYERTSCLGNLGRAFAGQNKYDEALEKFSKAADCLGDKDFRKHLYRAHYHVTLAWKTLESSQFEDFTYKQCLACQEEIKLYYGSKHRYYLWLCREIAKLALKGNYCRLLSNSSGRKRRAGLQAALEMSKISFEGHVEVYKYKYNHHKVGKSAEVVARVCLEYARNDIRKAADFQKAAIICLRLAVKVRKDTVLELHDDICTAVNSKCEELQRLESQAVSRFVTALPMDASASIDSLGREALKDVCR